MKMNLFDPITARDFPEDFKHENGNYYCKCSYCYQEFRGHKRRVVCKQCTEFGKYLKDLKENIIENPYPLSSDKIWELL